MKKVSIVGFGRFGKTLYRLIKDDFAVTLFNRSPIETSIIRLNKNTWIAKDLRDVYKSEVIFFCVPISSFEKVIKEHQKYFSKHHVLIDVLSVKLHPQEVFLKYIRDSETQALLTHPMFGPDSSKNGFVGLPIIIDKCKTTDDIYSYWKDYFQKKHLRVIEMTARDHDRLAAASQGLTHFIGRLLKAFDFKQTPIDSLGTKILLEVLDQTVNDSWELFTDLQQFNPYTKQMRIKLGQKYDTLYNKLLPRQKYKRFITYGIQGGKGSFNEEAIFFFLKKKRIKKYQIKYLFTAENVFKALHAGEIDCGQVAIHNSVGGIVDETIDAMAKYKFIIINKFTIKIAHALMVREDADISDITTIMTHPQVLAQCKTTLSKKYPHLKQISGKDELIDQTKVAKLLSEKKLPKSTATMGSKTMASLFGLKVIEDNLQDARKNYTSFLQLERK